MIPVLETRNLVKYFDGLKITDHVHFKLLPGARHALIGPNGAGKTTFLNQITGLLSPCQGSLFLQGQDITSWSVEKRAKAGLSRTFQINQLFDTFTPLETLMFVITERENLGFQWLKPFGSQKAYVEEAITWAQRLTLLDVLDQPVATLSYGQKRLLEIAMGLATHPCVLLLDEPSAGVPVHERGQILDCLFALPPEVSILLIEHDMDFVFQFASYLSVLVHGAIALEGEPSLLAHDPRLYALYLGEDQKMPFS